MRMNTVTSLQLSGIYFVTELTTTLTQQVLRDGELFTILAAYSDVIFTPV